MRYQANVTTPSPLVDACSNDVSSVTNFIDNEMWSCNDDFKLKTFIFRRNFLGALGTVN